MQRDFAAGQIVFGRRGPVLFSSDGLVNLSGGRSEAAALISDTVQFFLDESPLALAGLMEANLPSDWRKGGDMMRVVPMSDSAARSLTGLSGNLLHVDSVKLTEKELLIVLLNGDGCTPCSFHAKYTRGDAGWIRADASSYAMAL